MDASGILRLINIERTSRGLKPLSSDSRLNEAAQNKAEDMSNEGYFSHTSPTGITPWQLLRNEGYEYKLAAENIAFDSDPSGIVAAWMASPGHRANILNPELTSTGVGLSRGIYEGHRVTFAAQLFAKARTEQASPLPVPAPIPARPVPAQAPQTIAAAQAALPAPAYAPPAQPKTKAKIVTQSRSLPAAPIAKETESSPASSTVPTTTTAEAPAGMAIISKAEAIVSYPPQSSSVKADHSTELFIIAPALLAAAAIRSLRHKLASSRKNLG